MRFILLPLLLLSLVTMAASCGGPGSYVNGYWNLTTPAYAIPLDTSAACAASADIGYYNSAYYNTYGFIVGTNSSGTTACCPTLAPGYGSGPCCSSNGENVTRAMCQNYVCLGNASSSAPCVVQTCLVMADYDWMHYDSSTGVNGADGSAGGVCVGVVIASIIGWLSLFVAA